MLHQHKLKPLRVDTARLHLGVEFLRECRGNKKDASALRAGSSLRNTCGAEYQIPGSGSSRPLPSGTQRDLGRSRLTPGGCRAAPAPPALPCIPAALQPCIPAAALGIRFHFPAPASSAGSNLRLPLRERRLRILVQTFVVLMKSSLVWFCYFLNTFLYTNQKYLTFERKSCLQTVSEKVAM